MADSEQADNNENQAGNTSREWEVVSLTASAYAAAPGPGKVNSNEYEKSSSVIQGGGRTSDAMFMSGHFVFPPSQHENLPLAPENVEINREHGGGDSVHPLIDEEEGGKSDIKNPERLNISNEYPGIPIFDENGNILYISSNTEFEDDALYGGSNDKDQNFNGESMVTSESVELSDHGLDSGLSNMAKHADKDKYDETNLPCEAWWKKQAISLYGHAKETNTFWSIFVAAAVMGLVIIGQRWQQERWQILQLKWQFSINDQKMSRMLGPLSRLKDVIISANPRGSFIRSSSSVEH